jgi:hypothetical protein
MFLLLGRFNWLRKHIGFTSVTGCPDHGSLTLICVYDEAGDVIEAHEHTGDFTSGGCVNPHFAIESSDGFANHKTRKTTG